MKQLSTFRIQESEIVILRDDEDVVVKAIGPLPREKPDDLAAVVRQILMVGQRPGVQAGIRSLTIVAGGEEVKPHITVCFNLWEKRGSASRHRIEDPTFEQLHEVARAMFDTRTES